MTYSSTAALSLIVHCIVNYNALRNKYFNNTTPAGKTYRYLLWSILAFFFFDAIWGVLYDMQLIKTVFFDTVLYFVAMAASVFLWTRFVIDYLREQNLLIKILYHSGRVFLVFVGISLFLNFFIPVMFWFDENGKYHASSLRYVTLVMQIIMFLSSSLYVLMTMKEQEHRVRRHHLAIGSLGIVLTIMVVLQVTYPLLPMYSIGSLIAVCILHTFVLEDMKDDRRVELERLLVREQEREQELSSAKNMALKDPLTGVKNKHAYAEWEEKIDSEIDNGKQEPFAVVVCDINDLKQVNDLYGHKEGDECIKNACRKICEVFSHSPVFRIGGDEFAVILTGGDYHRRKELIRQINYVPKDLSKVKIGETVSAGLTEYDKNKHHSLMSVFEEADIEMYRRKKAFKKALLSNEDDVVDKTEITTFKNDRKKILIADDIESNREILGDLLHEDYEIVYASDGMEALDVMRNNINEIDLVILDMQMTNKNGREVIAEMQVDEDLRNIPVVIITIDQDAELDCLKSGAMDFISKPYPDIEIVKARI